MTTASPTEFGGAAPAKRKRKRIQPLKAIRAIRALIADKEDTSQVFKIIDALSGDSVGRGFRRFVQTETGRRILAEKRNLVATLSERTRLAALPEGTLGRAYHEFMAEEDLTADGLVEASEAVERIDEILDVPGIDVVFIGPNDLSYSYGDRGRQTPRVQEAIAKVLAAGKKRGIPVGRTGGMPGLPELMQQGFLFFQGPSELALLRGGADPLLKAAGKTPPDPATRPLY